MNQHHHRDERNTGPSPQSFFKSRTFLVMLGFLAIAVLLLWKEHQAHILGVGLILLLFACPLMHLFMHHGHGNHAEHDHTNNQNTRDDKTLDN